jgi:hypothetical protein
MKPYGRWDSRKGQEKEIKNGETSRRNTQGLQEIDNKGMIDGTIVKQNRWR